MARFGISPFDDDKTMEQFIRNKLRQIFNKIGMFSTTTTVCSMGHTTSYKLSPTFESAPSSAITLTITVDHSTTLPTSTNDVP